MTEEEGFFTASIVAIHDIVARNTARLSEISRREAIWQLFESETRNVLEQFCEWVKSQGISQDILTLWAEQTTSFVSVPVSEYRIIVSFSGSIELWRPERSVLYPPWRPGKPLQPERSAPLTEEEAELQVHRRDAAFNNQPNLREEDLPIFLHEMSNALKQSLNTFLSGHGIGPLSQ